MKVLVIGGGVGGLALAQGLRRAGVDVAAFERDRTPTDRMQGYRIHINRSGSRALHACLPPHLFDTLVATASAPNPRAGIGMYDHRLRELIWFDAGDAAPPDPVDSGKSISRISLRQVMLSELDDMVHFDKIFTHATTPATCGEAIDVPVPAPYPSPGSDERTATPGAAMLGLTSPSPNADGPREERSAMLPSTSKAPAA